MNIEEIEELLSEAPNCERLSSIDLNDPTDPDSAKLREFNEATEEARRTSRRIQIESIESASCARLTM